MVPRWGSKSWSGFELPKIFLETVPNTPEAQPRVVVVFHLFFKLPHKEKSKYKANALPELGAVMPADRFSEPFNARVVIKGFSEPKDPGSVDYDAALMQVAAEIVSGPMQGTKIGLRFEAMHDGKLAKLFARKSNARARLVGTEVNMNLTPWDVAINNEPLLGTTMIYDETDLDLLAPIFWITGGPLQRSKIRGKR